MFDEFKKVTSKEWKQKIQYELKGEDYNSKLIWKSFEGLNIKPFYHYDDDKVNVSINHRADSWKIGQSIFVINEKKANLKALNLIKKGVESINFIINDPKVSVSELFLNIDVDAIRIYIEPTFLDSNFLSKFNDKNFSKKNFIFLLNDPIGNFAKNGNWHDNFSSDNKKIFNALTNLNHLNGVISVDTGIYQNAGANIVQQIACASRPYAKIEQIKSK